MEEIGAYSSPASSSSAKSASVSYNSAASAAHDPSISDLQSFGVTSTPDDNTGTTSHPEASPARTQNGMASRTAPSGATTSGIFVVEQHGSFNHCTLSAGDLPHNIATGSAAKSGASC